MDDEAAGPREVRAAAAKTCAWPQAGGPSFISGGREMRRIALLALIAGLFVPVIASQPAHAQATRTWVSGVGDDANPCSRTAPCKTFPGAISKTAAGGEINCLDSGGFGVV